MTHRGGATADISNHIGMTAHGGSVSFDPANSPGFSYFLRMPDTTERNALSGAAARAGEILAALYSVLPPSNTPHRENPKIPSGYTYLAQFLAHDLVQSNEPMWLAERFGLMARNLRRDGLVLDTMTGGGPTACPMSFAANPGGHIADDRSLLRLGNVVDGGGRPVTGVCGLRDLPHDLEGAPPGASSGTLVVADPRNGYGPIVRQIAVLFALLHNAIVVRLAGHPPVTRYSLARTAVLTIYHTVIREDLLRRLLDERVYAILAGRPPGHPDWIWDGQAIPFEFSHGAFRFGHSMVRRRYALNRQTSLQLGEMLGGDGDRYLEESWVVEWSKFFDLGGTANRSLAFQAVQSQPLNDSALLPAVSDAAPGNMMLRDWSSAVATGGWRFDALIAALPAHYAALPRFRLPEVTQWLRNRLKETEGNDAQKQLIQDNLAMVADNLPLSLYVILEAEFDDKANAERLGPLGSIIAGEVIFRRLADETARLCSFIPAARTALGADWNRIGTISSMPDLIRLTADWGGFAACGARPFI